MSNSISTGPPSLKQDAGYSNQDAVKLSDNSEGTPSILFNPFSGQLVIKGKSTYKNIHRIYEPLREKIYIYIADSNSHYLNVNLKLEEMNSFSLEPIYKLLKTICTGDDHDMNINIRWHYERNDDDMLLHGEIFETILKKQFDYIPY